MDFRPVIRVAEVPKNEFRTVDVRGETVLICEHDGDFHAIGNICPHLGGRLCEGRYHAGTIRCPVHFWDFEIVTGISASNPNESIPTFPIRVSGEMIEIDFDAVGGKPEISDAEYLKKWERHGDEHEPDFDAIQKMAKSGRSESGSLRTTRPVPGFDPILFRPAQLARIPRNEDESVRTEMVIGPNSKKPMTISMPIFVSHISYGSLSPEAKTALARGSSAVGTAIGSGEGGLLPSEREATTKYIFEIASGKFGVTDENLKKADALEIKIGQAAKGGMGGHLPGKKVTAEIAKVRGLKPGADAISPAHHADILTGADLKKKVAELRKVSGGVPIGVKIAAGHLDADLHIAIAAKPDFITIDGRGGSTGSAPLHIRDHVCVPTVFAIARARKILDENSDSKIQLVATGGIRTAPDIAKVLALGADAVALASSPMMAIGCQQYRACHLGTCPVGIATQDPELRKRFDIEKSAKRLSNFLRVTNAQLSDFVRICGYDDVSKLSPDDLITTSDEYARHLGIEHI